MQTLVHPSQMIVSTIPSATALECAQKPFSAPSNAAQPAYPGLAVITAAGGFRIHGRLTGIGSGSVRIESAVPIEPKLCVELTIPDYLPVRGTVGYCKHSGATFQSAIYFRPHPTPVAETGDRIWAHSLCPRASLGSCHVLDRTENSLSFSCEGPVAPGAWVRLELATAVVFGEVNAVVPLTDPFYAIGLHIDGVLFKLPTNHSA